MAAIQNFVFINGNFNDYKPELQETKIVEIKYNSSTKMYNCVQYKCVQDRQNAL